MKDFPQIFTFYSFKGGVGRSMAVLNVAYGLAAKGRNVLVLDMDLEAPGLSGFLRRQNEIGAFARCDVLDLVRWAADFSHACQQSSEPLDPASFPPLTDFIVSVPREKLQSIPHPCAELGRLDIVPVDEERDYYDRLTALAMGSYQQDALVRMGSVLHAWLKSRRFPIDVPDYYGPNAERTSAYDYVLVDSRTGVTETGGLCIGPLSDQLVVLTALNDQNVQGTRRFLEEVGILAKPSSKATENGQDGDERARRLDPKPTLIVASPVPPGEIRSKRERLEQLQAALGKAVVKLSYHPQMALMESIFTRDYRDEYLAGEYNELLRHVLDMAGEPTVLEVSPGILKRVGGPFSEWRDILARILRLGSSLGMELALAFLLRLLDRKELREDRDFVLWDRVCRVLSNDKQTVSLVAFSFWANVLSQWSLCSTQPDLARLRREAALQCHDQILQADEASLRQKAEALVNRGVMHAERGDTEQAIADYTAVIEMSDAPAEQKALALVNRGVMHEERGDTEQATADYTAVIQMSDAPAEQKAKALVNRGGTYGEGADTDRDIADYTAVIQMPDAPAEQKAEARIARGWCYFLAGRIREAIEEQEHAVSLDSANWCGHANLAVALLVDGEINAASAAYDEALALATAEDLAEIAADLAVALEKYGPIPEVDQIRDRIETRRRLLERETSAQV